MAASNEARLLQQKRHEWLKQFRQVNGSGKVPIKAYQLEDFVVRLQGLPPADVLSSIDAELARVEHETLRGPSSQHKGASAYSRRLGALRIVLSRGTRPSGATDGDIRLFRPLVEAFIASGALNESCRALVTGL